jgi:hypothetical protein
VLDSQSQTNGLGNCSLAEIVAADDDANDGVVIVAVAVVVVDGWVESIVDVVAAVVDCLAHIAVAFASP